MPKVSARTHDIIKNIIRYTCNMNCVLELADEITYKFNNKLTSTWGEAFYPEKIIDFSTLLWLAKPEKRYNTIIHEVCHIIAWHKHGDVRAHGRAWKNCMRLARVEAEISSDSFFVI